MAETTNAQSLSTPWFGVASDIGNGEVAIRLDEVQGFKADWDSNGENWRCELSVWMKGGASFDVTISESGYHEFLDGLRTVGG